MLNVALTGNIAAGKSSVVELFRRWGATIVDADELARQAQSPGGEVLAAIVRRFGADVLAADGTLDRVALRSKVMGDDEALSALNTIVHPAVKQRREELHREAEQRGDVLLVNDIPLLFEVLDPAHFDVVVLVDAPVAVRRTRLRAMRGLANEDADRMIAAQMPAERKRARSHLVIDNAGDKAELERQARRAFEDLRQRAARAAVAATGATGRCLLLVAADAQDERDALRAVVGRYSDADVPVRRAIARSAAAIRKAFAAAPPPGAALATALVADAARQAWTRTGRPGTLLYFSSDPDPVAVRLDLRPWGHDRLLLVEQGGAGLAPRADLLAQDNPLA
ncbi:MAG: dephospho-CoA kinase [Gemmatimonadales bacterium]